MSELFLKILHLSISASWIILAILLFRLFMKKSPKWMLVMLWGIVAFRLICPISIESPLSLVPAPVGNGILFLEWADNHIEEVRIINENSINYDAAVTAGRDPVSDAHGSDYDGTWYDQSGEPSVIKNTVVPVLTAIWMLGMLLFVFYTVISYLRLAEKVNTAIPFQDNIYQSETIDSPFVLGIINPKIYLPFDIHERDFNHVIAHEQAHIRRKDHWWKPLGFLLLTIHWFNPLLWLAYVLLCRDIELACDEHVIRELDCKQRADYTQSLVSYSINRRIIAACPLAFGEVSVKERVKSIMNYKKPAFRMIMVSVIACIAIAVCFLTTPIKESPMTDLINCHVLGEDCDVYIEPYCYPEGLDWDYENVPTVSIGRTGSLIFTVAWDTDTLVVNEDYRKSNGGSIETEKETYQLTLNKNGAFELEVSARNDYQIDEAIYSIQAETGLYVMKVIYGVDRIEFWSEEDLKTYQVTQLDDAPEVSKTAQLLPYPKDYSYSSVKIQNNTKPYQLQIFLEGKTKAGQADFENCAVTAFLLIDDLDVISFCDAGSENTIASFSLKDYVRYDPFYLYIGAENVKDIEYSTPDSSGVLDKADGTLFHKAERIRLDFLYGRTDLAGLKISALNEAGDILWNMSFPDTEEIEPWTHFKDGDWCITNIY